MSRRRALRVQALVVLALASAARVRAEVAGGGLVDADCRTVFEGVSATNGSSGVVCVDGDPSCDADGVADGTCRFAVTLCIGAPTASCTTVPLATITVGGLALVPPPLPASDGTCGPPLAVAVPVGGPPQAATLLAHGGGQLRDVDYLNLCCLSAAEPLAAARCALAIDLTASGCSTQRISRPLRAAFARARTLVSTLAQNPSRTALRRKAVSRLGRMQSIARRLARHDQCGYALGLIASYAQDVLDASASQ
jgi:hypothetical protein